MTGMKAECYGCCKHNAPKCPIYDPATRKTLTHGKRFEDIKKKGYPCFGFWAGVLGYSKTEEGGKE